MQIIKVTLPMDHKIAVLSCSHHGAMGRDGGAYLEAINQIKEKNFYAIHLGDFVDGIVLHDRRYSREEDTGTTVLGQYDEAEAQLRPIADQLLVGLMGNHDHTLLPYGNGVERLCKNLGVSYGTASCVIVVLDKKEKIQYKIFATHGYGSIRTNADDPVRRKANLRLSLKRKLKDKMSDCLVMCMGHTHRLLVTPPTEWLKLYTDVNRIPGKQIRSSYSAPDSEQFIHPDNRWYINAGSFYRLYSYGISTYAERAGYDPLDVGYALIEVREGKVINVKEVVL